MAILPDNKKYICPVCGNDAEDGSFLTMCVEYWATNDNGRMVMESVIVLSNGSALPSCKVICRTCGSDATIVKRTPKTEEE